MGKRGAVCKGTGEVCAWGRKGTKLCHEERVAGHSPVEDGEADTGARQCRTFLNCLRSGWYSSPTSSFAWCLLEGDQR